MKEEIRKKLDAHIMDILEKPHISNEDYSILKQALSELPNDSWDPMWLPLLMMIFSGFGGGKK